MMMMEGDWNEINRVVFPQPKFPALLAPPSALAFDPMAELLWTGNDSGRVTSFFGPEFETYTSFTSHSYSDGPVKQILMCGKGVLSVAAQSVHLATRTGMVVWHLQDERFKDLRCMTFTFKGQQEILLAGCQDEMFKVDINSGTISELHAEEGYTLLKRGGQYVCAATKNGDLHVLDPNTFSLVKSWKAHAGWINDMDVKADFLVTCGFSPRQQHGYMLDPLANVFNLRSLVRLPPIPFQPGAAFVRMHPRMSTTAIIASQTGQIQLVDIFNPNVVTLRQANIFDSYLVGMELAPSGEALALVDSNCSIHLWGSYSKVQFAEISNYVDFPHLTTPPVYLDWSRKLAYNIVGMPYYREVLLSAWPMNATYAAGAPPAEIDPEILSNMTITDFGGYAPNTKKTRRYQFEDTRQQANRSRLLAAPKFLSERARDLSSLHSAASSDEIVDAFEGIALDESTKKGVPVVYRKVEIKYSKFGVDDFDFKFYNKTKFSGLETHIANSYANSLLQLYKFTPIFRNLALHHTASACLSESCLLCEMGFLFDMLEKAQGQNCQATNLLKTFRGLPHAVSLGLVDEMSQHSTLTAMLQSTNRYLLDKVSGDFRRQSLVANHMEQSLMTIAEASIRCQHCANEIIRPASTYLHDLQYPNKTTTRAQQPTFSQILKASVERQESTRGWCDRCKRYQQLTTRKTIQSVPTVLMLNAALYSTDAKQLWSIPDWLPEEIGIIVENGQFYCYENEGLKAHLQRAVHNIVVYKLVGLVAEINSNAQKKPHLVSMIDVNVSEKEQVAEGQWHLFNDFLVRPTSKADAMQFDPTWKLPSILAYQVKSASHMVDDSWKEQLDTTLLQHHWSSTSSNSSTDGEGTDNLAETTEIPKPGTPVAIDAEFVALEREELEVRSDGTKETIRPSRLALARVSVLRGEGEQAGEAFIDDYIAQSEPVVDYLTAFSGIAPGDLERGRSRHALVNLKVAYKKMWLLLNLGVIFIGHGLAKDFRIINIHVPRAQVVDTVDLFFIRARQRRLSLRFLAWLLLREQIQKETHDSIEDARTALRLWRKYEEFIDAGIFDTMLNDVYSKGRELGFKAPSGDTNCNNNGGKAGALDDKPSGRDTPESPTGSTGTGSMGAATTTSGSGEGGGLITPMRRQVFPNFIPGRLKAFSSPLR